MLVNKKAKYHKFFIVEGNHKNDYDSMDSCSPIFSSLENTDNEFRMRVGCGPSYKELSNMLEKEDVDVLFITSSSMFDYYKSTISHLSSVGYSGGDGAKTRPR